MFDGVFKLCFGAAAKAAPCHSGPWIGARVASPRSSILRSSASSVKTNILARKR